MRFERPGGSAGTPLDQQQPGQQPGGGPSRLEQRRRAGRVRRAAISLLAAAVVCSTMLLIMARLENRFIFFPSRYPDGVWNVDKLSATTGCRITDCWLTTSDGVQLHGWWCSPPAAGLIEEAGTLAPKLILWFHGNAGNLSHRLWLIVEMARHTQAQVLIIDYRGYGRSQGSPDEEGLYLDAAAAWTFATRERGVPASRIVVLGKSLGGVPAIELATHVQPAGLIVQSSFTSLADMARHHMPWAPRFLIRTSMGSRSRIGSVRCPKLFVHGPDDEVVPFALGRALFDAAQEPKRFLEIPGAGHNETAERGGEAYYGAVAAFVEECAGAGAARPDPGSKAAAASADDQASPSS